MKPCYLIDPWLLELKPGDGREVRFNRLTSIKNLKILFEKYGASLVKFVDNEFRNSLEGNRATFQRPEWQLVGRLIAHASIGTAANGPLVSITLEPCPALSEECALADQWLIALAEHGCDESSPNWRMPIVVFPESRAACWPNQIDNIRELKYRINRRIPTARNLVCIENFDQHKYFENDLDPWRIGAIGTPPSTLHGAVGERREIVRRLPRPLHLLPLKFTFSEMWAELQKEIVWSCDHEEKAYFIPKKTWDPRTISQKDWRSPKIFATGTAQNKKGFSDREDRIWWWDPKENHWDVQFPQGGYYSVSHDGSILKKRP